MPTVTQEWLDLPAAAEYVGQSVRWIKARIYSGQIPWYNPTSRKSFVKKSDLDAFLESGRVERVDPTSIADEHEVEWDA